MSRMSRVKGARIEREVVELHRQLGAQRCPDNDAAGCLWCGRPYEPRRRGKPQRFCSTSHRRAFEQAVRAWGRQAIEEGTLSMVELKNAPRKTRAFSTEALAGSPVSDSGNGSQASGASPEGFWRDGVARLDPDRPPEQHPMPVLPERWRQFVADANGFLNGPWAARAAELGWDAVCLFGVSLGRIFWRDEPEGLVAQLDGRKIIELGRDRAVIPTYTQDELWHLCGPGHYRGSQTTFFPEFWQNLRKRRLNLPWELE